MTFSWTGRQLDSITKSNGTDVSFTYDANGMRTGKTVGTENFGYVWQDGKLVAEFYGNSETLPEGSTYNPMDTQYYIYDESGSPVAWSYADQYYYYIKNQQGDILGFTDDEGNLIATYEYDAWGKLLHTEASDQYGANLAEFNSLRYRGYQYDVETGLYYLQSRYYDPETGRFLNADDTDYLGASGTVLGYNLYAYCENNGVKYSDASGNSILLGTILGAVLSGLTYYLEWRLNMRKWNTWHFIAYVATAAALGAIGAWLKQAIDLIKLGKLAAKLPRLIPIIKQVLKWGVTGIKMGINGYLKGLTRKKGESLGMYVIRVFAIPVS